MKLKLIISNECNSCSRAEITLKNFVKHNPEIEFTIEDISRSDQGEYSIVPAVFINDELYSYGELNQDQLAEISRLK